MKNHDEELKDHFSAYVKRAIENNTYAYFKKKCKISEAEAIYENCSELAKVDTEDILLQIDKISENFSEGVIEIKQLLEQIENYHLFIAIKELNCLQKNVIVLRILHEKSFGEIGVILGIDAKKAEYTYYNAISKVRKMLGGKGYEF